MLITLGRRLNSRIHLTRSFGSDDLFIIFGAIFVFLEASFATVTKRFGFGRHCAYLSKYQLSMMTKWVANGCFIAFVCKSTEYLIPNAILLVHLWILLRPLKKRALTGTAGVDATHERETYSARLPWRHIVSRVPLYVHTRDLRYPSVGAIRTACVGWGKLHRQWLCGLQREWI